MSQLDLSRLQFAMTSIYHFLFVPVTIGLAFLVAVLQTMWHRSGDSDLRRLTKFFGTLLLINVAIGVVTGLIQEFQFGMNWAQYSSFVGDVFGAPLAMEGLAAFFLESTFLGLWLFGWNVLPKRVHLACIWLVAIGTALSAAFIMAANSWMQHPVGYTVNSTTGRAELTSISAVFTNPVFLWAYPHVLLASAVTGCLLMLAVSAWHLKRQRNVALFTHSAKVSIVVLFPVSIAVLYVGSHLGVIETTYQPMKVAAMEAQWTTCAPCSFSVAQIGGGKNDETPTKIIQIPHLLSLLATQSWNGQVVGLNELQSQYQQKYGPGDYIPNVFIQYWSMRVMAYLGSLLPLLALWAAWLWRRQRLAQSARVPDRGRLGGAGPVRHEHRRLAADRERPPALDRAGTDADQGRQLCLGLHRRGGDQPAGLPRPLRGRRGHLGRAHGPLRPARPRARRTRGGSARHRPAVPGPHLLGRAS